MAMPRMKKAFARKGGEEGAVTFAHDYREEAPANSLLMQYGGASVNLESLGAAHGSAIVASMKLRPNLGSRI